MLSTLSYLLGDKIKYNERILTRTMGIYGPVRPNVAIQAIQKILDLAHLHGPRTVLPSWLHSARAVAPPKKYRSTDIPGHRPMTQADSWTARPDEISRPPPAEYSSGHYYHDKDAPPLTKKRIPKVVPPANFSGCASISFRARA